MDFSIRQCRAFTTVARLGSFTRAAVVLHVSQPALTVQIKTLELSLGVRLLDRNSRGVELTRAGRELLPLLQKTVLDVDTVMQDARELGGASAGTVRIAVLPSFAASFLPKLLRDSRSADADIQFVVKDAVANVVNALVISEEVDIGLTGGDFTEPELEVVHAADDRLCLVYRSDHPIGRKRRLTIRDILELPLVLTAQGTSIRAVVDASFAGQGRVPIVACEPTYMMTAVAMVEGGMGVTILPGYAREIAAIQGLQSRTIDDPSFIRPIALVKRKGRTLPPAAAAFMDRCSDALSQATCQATREATRPATRRVGNGVPANR